MKKLGPSFLISLLLHVGLILLAFINLQFNPPPLKVTSVPVTIVSDMPSRQMAEAPVDELAVKTPAPIPQPEPVPPQPPTPVPPQPVPTPVKPAAKPTPAPAKPTPVPPDKNGLKKVEPTLVKTPTPVKSVPKAKPQDDLLSRLAATPSQAPTRRPAQASTQKTTGASTTGAAAADAGPAVSNLGKQLRDMWNPNCDVPGGDQVVLQLTVRISPAGRVIGNPVWLNKRNDPVWEAAFNRASAAIAQGQQRQLYGNLPQNYYNADIPFTFDAKKACINR